ncbi:hypothetical protein ACFYR1_49860 [Streptomyces canus]|uniref:hypothetical protein n=1 Tax=Streptomyces canus TaxID=58343 RepID=UPI0036BF3BA8
MTEDSPKRKMIGVGVVTSSVLLGSVSLSCAASEPASGQIPDGSPRITREFLSDIRGRGYMVLSDEAAKEIGVDPVSSHDGLDHGRVESLYVNGDRAARQERWSRYTFPEDGEYAGQTDSYDLKETGEPANIIVPKGVKVIDLAYVDSVNNEEEIESVAGYLHLEASLWGSTRTARVFFGVDEIRLVPPHE